MRLTYVVISGLILAAVASTVPAQENTDAFTLTVPFKERKTIDLPGGGTESRWYISFTATPNPNPKYIKPDAEYWAYIYENKDPTKGIEQEALQAKIKLSETVKKDRDISVVLAVDTSGSMTEATAKSTRIEQAKEACSVFFSKLPAPPKAEAGLILFNHDVYKTLPLKSPVPELIGEINAAKAAGGTAYLDAALKAIAMLREVKDRDKVLVLMTDGVDLNSKVRDLNDVVKAAKGAGVKIFTIGIGEVGKAENVTSALVLDISGSMNLPAGAEEKVSKLKALITAATRFVDIMPDSRLSLVRSTVMLFSDAVKYPNAAQGNFEFTSDKGALKAVIAKLLSPEEKAMGGEFKDRIEAKGETALFDATWDAICQLEGEDPKGEKGKKAIVALTDGIDNSSRHRKSEVIQRAKDAKVPLYMLGLGQTGEIDETVMEEMARETGGFYKKVGNEKDLIDIFESLSVKIHDVGIDEVALKSLAFQTGGQYFAAKDVDQLKMKLEDVITKLPEKTIPVDFRSHIQEQDVAGKSNISLTLVTKSGTDVTAGPTQTETVQGHGLIVAQISPLVYLSLLVVLGALLAVPASFKKMFGGKR